jgi:hypothetical protein
MSKKKFKNALKFYNSLSGDEREAVTRNYVELSKMDLIELVFQNRPYYNDLEKIVNTHRKELAQRNTCNQESSKEEVGRI